jgi:hypothetical protein
MLDSSNTGVLHKGPGKGNCYALGGLGKQISSYFPSLIAVWQNNLLLKRSCSLRSALMTEFPRKSNRVSRLEALAFAFATALVALIAVGVVPGLHG